MLDIHLWVSPVIHLSQYHISDLHNKRDTTKGEQAKLPSTISSSHTTQQPQLLL